MAEVIAAVLLAFPGLPAFNVTCSKRVEWEGREFTALYHPGEQRIELGKRTCFALRKIHRGGGVPRAVRAYSLYSLGHELAHHAGAASERDATCQGLAWVKRLGRALGARHPFRERRLAIRLVNGAHVGEYTCRRLG